jgi:putative phosphoribosyl transferase
MMFRNRVEAGEKLAQQVKGVVSGQGLVLGIPRGGVVVAKKVAEKLGWLLAVIVTKKIGFPGNEELAIGAVAEAGEPVWDEEMIARFGFEKEALNGQLKLAQKKVRKYIEEFREGRELVVKGKIVVVVDDGVATGRTMEAGVDWLRQEGVKQLILAAPVCALDTFERLKPKVDKFICLHVSADFMAVGQFYQEFEPVNNEQVKKLLLK